MLLFGLLLHPASGTSFYLLKIRWVYVFLLAFLAGHLLMPFCKWIAMRLEMIDRPDSRKIHDFPTPRTGGIAVFGATMVALLRNRPLRFDPPMLGVLAAGVIFIAMGLADDRKGLSASFRLVGQLLIAGILISAGALVTFVPAGWPLERVIEAVITVVWVIGIVNAVNFLDGMDGLAAGFGIVSAGCFFVLMVRQGAADSTLGYLTIALIGALVAFLPYNFRWRQRAAIFLGDSGSTFIGFMLAAIAVMGSWSDKNPMTALTTPLLILGVPIFDMTYITIARIRSGRIRNFKEWIEYVGKDHFHHRLAHLGLSQKATVGFILCVSAILGLGALAMSHAGPYSALLLVVQGFLVCGVIVVLMLMGRRTSD